MFGRDPTSNSIPGNIYVFCRLDALTSRPTVSELWSFKIRHPTYPKLHKFRQSSDFKALNCERVGRVLSPPEIKDCQKFAKRGEETAGKQGEKAVINVSRPTFSQLWSFQIRRTAFLNYIR